MIRAFTRAVSPLVGRCELTHLPRTPIDPERAAVQHRAYERALEELGCLVERLPEEPDLPDGVFVEDTAVVLDEVAVLARPGAPSRRPEVRTVAPALERYRELLTLEEPATLDGGDVLRVGDTLYVGRSTRTNGAALEALGELLAPRGYRVVPVEVTGCLHLKTAVTWVGDRRVLANPAWIEAGPLAGLDVIEVHPEEPMAANVLRVGDAVVCASAFPRTRKRLESTGLAVRPVDLSELARAEGGVSCCSILLEG